MTSDNRFARIIIPSYCTIRGVVYRAKQRREQGADRSRLCVRCRRSIRTSQTFLAERCPKCVLPLVASAVVAMEGDLDELLSFIRPPLPAEADGGALVDLDSDGGNVEVAEAVESLGDAVVQAEEGEIRELVEIASAGVRRKRFEPRSDELMAHARMERERKRLRQAVATAQQERQSALEVVNLVASQNLQLAQTLGLKRTQLRDPALHAIVQMRIACVPLQRGITCRNTLRAQGLAAMKVACCMLQQQSEHIAEICARPDKLGGNTIQRQIVAFDCQWDETSQKLRQLAHKGLPAATKLTTGQTSHQVMVCSGGVWVARELKSPLGLKMTQEYSHVWHAPALRLDHQDANHILEGIHRSFPLDLEDEIATRRLLGSNDALLLVFGCDRASVNFRSCKSICSLLHEYAPAPILFHCEPCGLHGVSLVKCKTPALKAISVALHGFSRWTRQGKNLSDLADAIAKLVHSSLRVQHASRPPALKVRAKKLVSLLYGDLEDTSSYLWKQKPHPHQPQKTAFLLELEALVDNVDFGHSGAGLTHWNYVEAGSEEHMGGMRVGSKQCPTADDSKDRITLVIVNFLTGRSWVAATVSRWTNVFNVVRRFVVGIAVSELLPTALRELKTRARLEDSLEQSLEKIIAEDRSDYSSREKLRLLKIAKNLCTMEAMAELCVMAVSLGPCESLQYDIMGFNHSRATLGALIHPITSPLVLTGAVFLDMAGRFDGSEGGPWELLAIMGFDFDSPELRMSARRHMLQLSAGLQEVWWGIAGARASGTHPSDPSSPRGIPE